jgi:hypothetical protein
MVASLWRNRGLLKALVQREVIGRYRGSVFAPPFFRLTAAIQIEGIESSK